MMPRSFIRVLLLSLTCTGLQAQVTSVTQVKDISVATPCYHALQSLIEHHRVLDDISADGKFRPDDTLTRLDFVWMLSPSLSAMKELIKETAGDSANKDEVNAIAKSLFKPYSYGTKKGKITSVKDYPDVNSGDYFVERLKGLTEMYGITISDADKSFSPKKPMTFHDVSAIFSNAFSYKAVKDEPATMTRGDFAMALDGLLNNMADRIDEAGKKMKR